MQFARDNDVPPSVRSGLREHPDWPLWRHGLVPDPRPWVIGPSSSLLVRWLKRPLDGHFEGEAFGDGSCSSLVQGDQRLSRAGWCVVQVDARGDLVASLCGLLPGLHQASDLAEAFGLLMYLTHVALGPYRYHSDCDWVVSSFQRGRLETTGQCAPD